MDDVGKAADAGDLAPAVADLPLRAAAPSRSAGPGPLRGADPTYIHDYRLIGQLGVGGMGIVYLAEAPEGDRVAIKLVHAHLARDPRFRARFVGEVRAATRVPGFATARVLGSGSYDDRPYLVTEYLDGIPLSRLINDSGPLDPATLQSVAIGVAAALAAIHGVGLVHRDLKPSNVMVTLGGVRVIDFGIARALDANIDVTGTGNIVGSLGWASPEQLRAEPAMPSMDIFGWGCLVAFAATGRHPFGGEEAAARAWRILEGEPDFDGVPEPLRDLVEVALDRDPDRRPDARQLLLALTVGDMSVPLPRRTRRWLDGGRTIRRRITTMAVALPLALAMVFALAETTSELIGGPASSADAGRPVGDGDHGVIVRISPEPHPPTQAPGIGGGLRRTQPEPTNTTGTRAALTGPPPTTATAAPTTNPPPTTTAPPTTTPPTTTAPTTPTPTDTPTPQAPQGGQGGGGPVEPTPTPTPTPATIATTSPSPSPTVSPTP
jgi:serine/threonine protein kinase